MITTPSGARVAEQVTAPPDTAPAPAPLRVGARPRILVISLRRIGDVLLTTPLIRSLRAAWPDATIDVLVFAGTSGILKGNPDIDTIIPVPAKAPAADSLR